MESLSEQLQRAGRPELARLLKEHGTKALQDYSAGLFDYRPRVPIEPILYQAFRAEMQRLNRSPSEISQVLQDLENRRVLQTSPHLTATEGPTFFGTHWMATRGLPQNAFYVVASFSGVPFSNNAWSGCLNYSEALSLDQLVDSQCPQYSEILKAEQDRSRDTLERRLSLIPSAMRDGLVYRSVIHNRLQQLALHFTPRLQTILPEIEIGASYASWALRFCEALTRALLPNRNIIYLDLNEVMATYLQTALGQSDHPISRLFFDEQLRDQALTIFGKEIAWFSCPYVSKKKEKLDRVQIVDGKLQSRRFKKELTAEIILDGLQHHRWCPGVFLSFTVLSFLNGFRCFGSFEQVEYLARYRQQWKQLHLFESDQIDYAATDGLTTGRFYDSKGIPIFPLDLFLGREWEFPDSITLAEIVEPLMPRLLGR